ncbi:hypothetical protein MCHI_003938 [Candidatus Magnetoovum chiemensis]|nr:hypothetical protein MCHI_003938 [Candidatus Magnetoovum chiemensis]
MITADISEAALNQLLSIYAPIDFESSKVIVRGGLFTVEKDMFVITYKWHLSEPSITIDHDNVSVSFDIHVKGKVRSLVPAILANDIVINDAEHITAKLAVSYEDGKIKFKVLDAPYPIGIKLKLRNNEERVVKLGDFNLKDYIPQIEYPFDLNIERGAKVFGKEIKVSAKPQIKLYDGFVRVCVDSLKVESKGNSVIPSLSPKVLTLGLKNAQSIDMPKLD